MTGRLVWFGLAALLAIGPSRYWKHQLHAAEKNCRCRCVQVFGDTPDYPPAEPGEQWHFSLWFGAHATVCAMPPQVIDGRALQTEIDRREDARILNERQ
jgi:hypothetical protein